MKMRNLLTSAALSLALLAGTAIVAPDLLVTSAAAAKPSGPQVGKKFNKIISEIQKALNEGQLDVARAKLDEANTIPEPKAGDLFYIYQFRLSLAIKQSKYDDAAAAFEVLLNNEYFDPANRFEAMRVIIQNAVQHNDYAKAVEYADKSTAEFGKKAEILYLASFSNYFMKKYDAATPQIREAIQMEEAAGKTPDKQWYDIWVSAAAEGGPAVAKAQEALAARAIKFNDPVDWRTLTDLEQRGRNFSDSEMAEMFRINLLTNSIDPREYESAGRLLLAQKLYGDAIDLLQKGVDEGYVKGADTAMLAKAKKDMAADKAIIDQIAAAAKTAPNGKGLLNVAKTYRNYHDGAKAVEYAKAAVAKGGLNSAEEGKLQIGIAQLEAGDKEAAKATFTELSSAQTASGALARLHLLMLRR